MAKKKVKSKRLGGPVREAVEQDDLQEATKYEAVQKSLIDLSPTEVKQMSEWVRLRVEDAKNSEVWKTVKDRILKYRAAYEDGVSRTTTGMSGSHDYRTKMAAAQCDGLTARLLNVFSVDPLLRFEGRNSAGLQNSLNVEKMVDYHHDVNVRLQKRGDEIATMLPIEGHCVMYTPWCFEIEKDKLTLVSKRAYSDGVKEHLIDPADPLSKSLIERLKLQPKTPERWVVVTEKKTTIVKNHPDLRIESLLDYLCPADAKPGKEKNPAWEAIRIPYTLADLEEMDKNKQIYSGMLKEAKLYLRKKKIEAEKERTTDRGVGSDSEGSEEPLDENALDSVLYCWVIWGLQKVPGMKGLQKVITLYNDELGKVLQTRLNGNVDKRPPFFHLRMAMIPWRWAGMGTMEMAYDGERAVNDLANSVLDEGAIYACLPYKYLKNKFPGGLSPFEFWKGIGLKNLKDFEPLQFPDRRMMDMGVASFIRANTERRTGQGDLQLGRESDITGKQPPTARGIMTILQEGQVRYTKVNFGVIAELCDYGTFIVKLFQQYMHDNTAMEILGVDRKEVFPDGLSRHQIMGSYIVNANMAAQQMAREFDAELNIQLYTLMQANPFIAKSLSAFYELTQNVFTSVGKKKSPLKDLSFYQNDGKVEGPAATEGMGLTPEEQQYATTLLQSGVPIQEVKSIIEQARQGGGARMGEEDQAAETQLLTGHSTEGA